MDRVSLIKAVFDGRDVRYEPVLDDPSRGAGTERTLVIDQEGIPVAWQDGRPPAETVRQLCGASGSAVRSGDVVGERVADGPGDPTISVVICTAGLRESLTAAIESAYRATRSRAELVVVVNTADRTVRDTVERVVADHEVEARIVLEPQRGLSRARNAGLGATDTDVVAFTDDDVIVDENWLNGVRRGFSRSNDIVAVTGMVPAAEIRTEAQDIFERNRSRWSTELTPEIYRVSERSRYDVLIPYSPGHIGIGANLSVRRSAVLGAGGFDEALGAGTGTGGGEDLEILTRLLRTGGAVAYEPSAIIWHVHRATKASLYRQLFEHSIGTSAFLTRTMLEPERRDMLRAVVDGCSRYLRSSGSKIDYGIPKSAVVMEMFGMLVGPALYGRERLRIARRRMAAREQD
jgi:GT2 family glycosyltransferase